MQFGAPRKKPLCPTVEVDDFGGLPCPRSIGNGNCNCGAYLNIEDPSIGLNSSTGATPDIAAQVDDLNPIEALPHHLPQTGIGPARQKLAVGNHSNDTPLWRIVGLKHFPDGSTIDIVKMDIEGAEQTVFAADVSWLARVRALIIEWHPDRCDPRPMIATLEAAGFEHHAANAARQDNLSAFRRRD